MHDVTFLRVFTDARSANGNQLGVIVEGAAVAADDRQAIAAELGFSETVFVDDPIEGRIKIFTPARELPFAGHPAVGTAWLLRHLGFSTKCLFVSAGTLDTSQQDGVTYVTARPSWVSRPFNIMQMDAPADIDELRAPPVGLGHGLVWAWTDERAGRLRTRVFSANLSVDGSLVEDEATGSASMQLAVALNRPLRITQGRGSVLFANPLGGDRCQIGGSVCLDEAIALN